MTVVSVAVTDAGAALAARLPYQLVRGRLGPVVRERWLHVDGLVLCCPVGVVVRVIAPLLAGKEVDPAVVSVDEAGRFVVPVVGGHAAGANDLARDVAALLGATPVVTTGTDANDLPALDTLPGFVATGDVAGVTRRWLDGHPPRWENTLGWPVPLSAAGDGGRVVVTDRTGGPEAGTVTLHPPSLVAGVGASSGAPADEVAALLARALDAGALAAASVALVATVDRKAAEPGIVALGRPLATFTAAELAAVPVPTPSAVVERAIGTPSVAEAAALCAAGPGAELVVPKQVSAHATVAIARRAGPPGHLVIVGLGPGAPEHRTPAAVTAVRHAHAVVGYGPYVDQCQDLLSPAQEVVRSPIGAEADRCREAVARARRGQRVALVCSGDAGVFGMASLALELAPPDGLAVTVVPGVTAALAAGAVLGAPLGHDHASISLSDLLTPWPVIERRLEATAAADLVLALYNPRSARRTEPLVSALAILRRHRPDTTPAAIVTNVARPAQHVVRTTLGGLDPEATSMLSLVLVGASTTRWIGDRMVTPRGYIP